MVAMVIGILVMSLLLGPSFSQFWSDTTTEGQSTVSEYDTIDKVWYQLTYCEYLSSNNHKCDSYLSTLQIARDHHSTAICSAVRNLMNCMDINCQSNYAREDAMRQVRSRCGDTTATTDRTAQSTTLSEYDTINNVFYNLVYCNYINFYNHKCDAYVSTLQIARDHHSTAICSAARNVMTCMDINCEYNSAREDAKRQVTARCGESDKQIAHNAIQNEVMTLTQCTFIFSQDNCSKEYRDFDASLYRYNFDIIEVCTFSYTYMVCLEKKCDESSDLNQSILRVRDQCGRFVNENETSISTNVSAVTPSVSEPDALTTEWFTLTSCSFKETTETCAREKYTLEFSRALHFEVCRNAHLFLDCLEDKCQYSRELTRSIMTTRASCSATNKKLQSQVVINNYISGEAESRRAKNILEILGIYHEN